MSGKRRILPRIPFRPYADVLGVPCNDRLADAVDPVNYRLEDVKPAYNDDYTLGLYEQTDLSTKIRRPRKRAAVPERFTGSQTLFSVIVRAILDSPDQMATLTQIYEYIQLHFDRYTSRKTWQNNVRHVLSIHGCFVKGPTSGMHAHYWYIQSNLMDEFQRGDFSQKQRAKRQRRTASNRPNNGKRKRVSRAKAEDLENLKEICDSVEGKTPTPGDSKPFMKPPICKPEVSWEDFYNMTYPQDVMNNDAKPDYYPIDKNYYFPPPLPQPTFYPQNVPFNPVYDHPPNPEPSFRPHYLDSPHHSSIIPPNYPQWEEEFLRGLLSPPGLVVGGSDASLLKWTDQFSGDLSVL